MEIIYNFKGRNGQLEIYSDKVVIKRKGVVAKMTQGFTKGDKTIFIREIGSLQFKKSGLLVGYIQLGILGGKESTKGVFDANKDENSITFTNNVEGEKVKEILENLIEISKQSLSTNTTNTSTTEELKKYKELLDMGIITQEEFDKKKSELLK